MTFVEGEKHVGGMVAVTYCQQVLIAGNKI